jgi:glycosyltransferase involved in cell wall biosynthesis
VNPKISIIVPIYNVEKYLSKCIDSILAQTFSDFELILVNDGSPDNCGEICDKYGEKDERIKVIHKENGGLSSARNAGIKMATGIYLGFIDSDDYIDEKMYEILYLNAVNHSSDVVVCDFLKVSEGECLLNSKSELEIDVLHFTNKQALEQLYISEKEQRVKWVIACNKLYKRSLFDHLEFKLNRLYEDEFIAHEILYKSSKVTLITKQLYYYVQRENSIVGSSFTIKKLDRVYALKERADFFRGIKETDLHNQAQRQFMDVFFWYFHKTKFEILNAEKELRDLKKVFNKNLFFLLKNPHISRRNKLALILFTLLPFAYFKLIKNSH